MKLATGFWQTYKEAPNDAEIASHQLMIRAGLIHKSGSGLYNYLPMGLRSIHKIENIIREEMDKAGCLELLMSVVTPGELWQETGRWDVMGDGMLKFKDKNERDLCISPTNEEAITEIFRKTIKSYKQLPVTLYQINTKFRDEIRPRYGLMRGREFTMKDAYSFSMDRECMSRTYDHLYNAYCAIIERLGLEYIAVEADGGAMADGDAKTHEFQLIADAGEDYIMYNAEAGYAANVEKAITSRGKLEFIKTDSTIEEFETPDKKTIEDVCNFVGCLQHQSLKTLLYRATYGKKDVFYMLMLLGDDELNEIKIQNFLGATHFKAATDTEIRSLELDAGYMGPYQLGDKKISVIYDEAIDMDAAYTIGSREGYHYRNFIPSRDGATAKVADIRMAKAGDFVPGTEHQISVKKGIEAGHIFELGDKYTKAMGVTVLNQQGKAHTPLMGCYGMGVTRLVAGIIEQCHDENGIMWPAAAAPYQVYFAVIGKKDETWEKADEVYKSLIEAGVEVLFDNRGQGPGVMFKDADLLGLPIRLVLGERDYQKDQSFEVKIRKTGESAKIKQDEILDYIQTNLKEL